MAFLPETVSDVNLGDEIIFEDYPTRTYYVDPVSKQLKGFCDGNLAMTQAVEIILRVEQFYYQIYTPNFGFLTRGIIGNDYGYVISEIKRRMNDSFKPDVRILGVHDIVVTQNQEDLSLHYECVVDTVFGQMRLEGDIEE